ncbi:MAG TPA: MoxR family ATPase [Spongiibacteraceae bacterium]|nr:MoxR family ATPase [Spongiibacteraceae bacterium]
MQALIERSVAAVGTVLFGKEHQIRLALCCLLARGHLLIEDLPGMGKTTLSQALAAVLGLAYQRVQFTSDMLPADILGTAVFNREKGQFHFLEGPIFSQLLLADEVNRSSPKTQSALLEAMAEGQVTIEGQTRQLPQPFFVIATQNPGHQAGTFPLPESQLDRFLMRISLGYPDPRAERALLLGDDRGTRLHKLQPVLTADQLQALQAAVGEVHASDSVLDYLQRLIAYTREQPGFDVGLSPRAALALLQAARAWALMAGRNHILPDDLQSVLPAVAEHRLHGALGHAGDSVALVRSLLDEVPVV